MILTAHQPTYLPWLGLFHKIYLSDVFCFFDDVQYETRGWNNRNYIYSANNEKMMLTVPVLSKKHRAKSYRDIKINNEINWQKKHWRSISLAYKRSKYYDLYADKLACFYDNKWEYLIDLNYEMLCFFINELKITTKVVRMSNYNFTGEKSSLVLDMCKKLECKVYIFGQHGKEYVERRGYIDSGIKVKFQKYTHPKYEQYGSIFTPYLSIIDLLFHHGTRSMDIILQSNAKTVCMLKEE